MSQRAPLFRDQAVAFHQQRRQWGDVASIQTVATKLVAWFLVAATAAICVFLFVAEYARKETAVGYLTPTKGTSKIFAPQRGTIKEVHVTEGAAVRDGQPLLTVETNQLDANGTDVNASMVATLVAQRDLLAKNITAEQQRVGSERDRLTAVIKGLEAEIGQLQGQIQLQTERMRLMQGDVAAAQQLRQKGFMTEVEYKKRQMVALEQKQGIASLSQQVSARHNQLTETRFALRQLPTVMAQKVQALRNDLAAAEQRITEINGRRAYVIRSPTDGRVSMVQATAGQYADPQRLQLEILPQDAVLQAELFVPARAIGFIEAGQPVRILYDAFPYQHFGSYTGQVSKVSQTILTGSDAAGPITLKEPAYRVTASLDRPDIDAAGKKIPVQADMLLKADIVLEKRSLADWLLSPFRGVRM